MDMLQITCNRLNQLYLEDSVLFTKVFLTPHPAPSGDLARDKFYVPLHKDIFIGLDYINMIHAERDPNTNVIRQITPVYNEFSHELKRLEIQRIGN